MGSPSRPANVRLEGGPETLARPRFYSDYPLAVRRMLSGGLHAVQPRDPEALARVIHRGEQAPARRRVGEAAPELEALDLDPDGVSAGAVGPHLHRPLVEHRLHQPRRLRYERADRRTTGLREVEMPLQLPCAPDTRAHVARY